MNDDDRQLLRALLSEQRVLALSVVADGEPLVGLLPYVPTENLGGALIHASRLAQHSRGLLPGAPVAGLIHQQDGPQADPMQLPRVVLQGSVVALERGSSEYETARQRYQARFPDSAQTFALGDFSLYELRWSRGRLVAGFGRALNLSRESLLSISGG
jgi:heme iron utilization protein